MCFGRVHPQPPLQMDGNIAQPDRLRHAETVFLCGAYVNEIVTPYRVLTCLAE
jgi:hypothetical protein